MSNLIFKIYVTVATLSIVFSAVQVIHGELEICVLFYLILSLMSGCRLLQK